MKISRLRVSHLIRNNVSDGAEEGARFKRPRAPSAASFSEEPQQDLEERGGALPILNADLGVSPPGFLSPSVKEYLELGKSIPGDIISYKNFAHLLIKTTGYKSRR
jgi:hypothetical protein